MELIQKYFSDFTKQQINQFESLYPLYKDWNEKINVISRKDIDGLYEKHVLHSLSIAAVFDFAPGADIIDIGTGGGFPGIPLAIFFPEVKFHLVDSIAKKLKVVEAVAAGIGLTNITTQHIRAEEIKGSRPARPGGGFDFAVSRAVAPLGDLWKWSKPLLKIRKTKDDGQSAMEYAPGLICLKGGDLAIEILESNLKPKIIEIPQLFQEEYFREKYLLYVPRK